MTINVLTSRKRLTDIVAVIDEYDVPNTQYDVDDLREYEPDQLAKRFGLTKMDSWYLFTILKEQTDPRYQAYCQKPETYAAFCDMITESLHNSLEGYNDSDKIVIRAFIADTKYASTITY